MRKVEAIIKPFKLDDVREALTDIGITGGGKGSNMLYLSGMQSEKVLTDDLISKVINQVEKKVLEIENKK